MTVRLFLFVVAILVLLVFSSQQFSSSGQTSAKEQAQKEGAATGSAKEEPLVKRFLEVFRGDLTQVKPAKGENS